MMVQIAHTAGLSKRTLTRQRTKCITTKAFSKLLCNHSSGDYNISRGLLIASRKFNIVSKTVD